MSKVAKLAFAMGGGVSLGSFSGAGLTQCIKQLILHGGYYEGGQFHHYSDIEIDVFSGASAGCISLGIMLRTLTDPEGEFQYIPNESTKPDTLTFEGVRLELESTDEDLKKRLAEIDDDNEKNRLLDLYTAAEITQRVQNNIWCNEINFKNLLNGAMRNIEAGVANKKAILDIAKTYFGKDANINPKNRRLLADRVIFVNTLANLDGLVLEGRDNHAEYMVSLEAMRKQANRLALMDGGRSKTHRDYRVFDINFVNLEDLEGVDERELPWNEKTKYKYPRRWFRIYPWKEGEVKEKSHNLLSDLTWRKICATSVGSGSIPPALEPTILERYNWEYNQKVWNATVDVDVPLGNDSGAAENDRHENTSLKHYFSYVDGGTFNNEPIREAHRAAAFIDNLESLKPDAEQRDFDRLIMFIDPYVDPSPHVLSQSYMSAKAPSYGETTHDVLKLPSGERLKIKFKSILGLAGTIFGAIRSEGTVKEGLRHDRYANKIEVTQKWAAVSSSALKSNSSILDSLIAQLQDWLNGVTSSEIMPPGPLSEMYALLTYVRRITTADNASPYASLKGDEIDQLQNHIYDLIDQDKLTLADISSVHKGALMKVLNVLNAERIGSVIYKSRVTSLIAIAPLKIENDRMGIQYLPGTAIGGFAGFASVKTNWSNVASAQWSSELCLILNKVIHKHPMPTDDVGLMNYVKTDHAQKMPPIGEGVGSDFVKLTADIQEYVSDIVKGVANLILVYKDRTLVGKWCMKMALGLAEYFTKRYTEKEVEGLIKGMYLGMYKHTKVLIMFVNKADDSLLIEYGGGLHESKKFPRLAKGDMVRESFMLRHSIATHPQSGAYEIAGCDEYGLYEEANATARRISLFKATISGKSFEIGIPDIHKFNSARLKPVLVLKCLVSKNDFKWVEVPETDYVIPTFELIG